MASARSVVVERTARPPGESAARENEVTPCVRHVTWITEFRRVASKFGGPKGQVYKRCTGSTSCGGGCVMRRSQGWARARLPGAHIMRLGAWYQVVGNNAPNLVVLDIARRNVAIPRDLLQISPHRPERFSVVPRSLSKLSEKSDDSASIYAVCPVSGTRVRLSGYPDSIECPSCGHRGAVDWRMLPTRLPSPS